MGLALVRVLALVLFLALVLALVLSLVLVLVPVPALVLALVLFLALVSGSVSVSLPLVLAPVPVLVPVRSRPNPLPPPGHREPPRRRQTDLRPGREQGRADQLPGVLDPDRGHRQPHRAHHPPAGAERQTHQITGQPPKTAPPRPPLRDLGFGAGFGVGIWGGRSRGAPPPPFSSRVSPQLWDGNSVCPKLLLAEIPPRAGPPSAPSGVPQNWGGSHWGKG